MIDDPSLSKRAYNHESSAASWEEIWEAGPYFRRISELMEDAKEFVVIVGWQIDSRLPMPLPDRPGAPEAAASLHPGFETLIDKITRLCAAKPGLQFYFLMWDHAYFFVLERETWQRRIWENVHDQVHFLFDNRVPLGGSHHEKIALIDGKIALLGGIDLCDERWDTPNHFFHDPRRSLSFKKEIHGPYHDLAVQLTGHVCTQIHEHVAMRWNRLSTAPFPKPKPLHLTDGGHRVYLSRTWAPIDAGTRGAPIIRENEFLFRDLIGLAERRIILEGQYYWSETINNLLIKKMHERKGGTFEIFLILGDLQYNPEWVQKMTPFQLGLLKKLEQAAIVSGTKLVMGCPYIYPSSDSQMAPHSNEFKPKRVYVHSKAVVIDDRFLSIGSTNLAARAFRLDTELNVTLQATTPSEVEHIQAFVRDLLHHWNLSTVESGLSSRRTAPIKLRMIHPVQELRNIRLKWPFSSAFPI
ncbi:MAG: phospholipase D-like domain-containing protein, partial [Bdellovibrionota bacterium]